MDMPDMPSEGIWRWERRVYPQKISSKPDVRVSATQELSERERVEAGPLAEQDRQRVAGELAQPARHEVPLVPGPDPLGVEAFGERAQPVLDPPPRRHQPRRPARGPAPPAAPWRDQVEPGGGGLGAQARAPVPLVAERPAGGAGEQSGRDRSYG